MFPENYVSRKTIPFLVSSEDMHVLQQVFLLKKGLIQTLSFKTQ